MAVRNFVIGLRMLVAVTEQTQDPLWCTCILQIVYTGTVLVVYRPTGCYPMFSLGSSYTIQPTVDDQVQGK